MYKIPDHLKNEYTQGGIIPVLSWWFDPEAEKKYQKTWSDQYINKYLKKFSLDRLHLELGPYRRDGASVNIHEALNRFKIYDKNVAIIGSTTPWIEAIALNHNNIVATVEYNEPVVTNINLKTENYINFAKKQEKVYDCIITFSSIEHSGLGRYGDPLDPSADIKTMTAIRNNLKDDGVLIWGAPIGTDTLVWNAHRIYGEKRLPLLFAGFKKVDYIYKLSLESIINMAGERDAALKRAPPQARGKKKKVKQPVIILKKQIL